MALQEEEEGEEEERLYSYSLIITFECTQMMYLMKPKPEKKQSFPEDSSNKMFTIVLVQQL
jgi:hypothetical protein